MNPAVSNLLMSGWKEEENDDIHVIRMDVERLVKIPRKIIPAG